MKAAEIRADVNSTIRSAMRDFDAKAEPTRDLDGNLILSYYLGSVFGLLPSGKYYTPFASSNVDACSRCKGEGCKHCGYMGSREAYEDSLWYEYMESALSKHGCILESGEGDPCDLFITRSITEMHPAVIDMDLDD